MDVRLKVKAQHNCPVCHTPPIWSPSGQLVAFTLMDGPAAHVGVWDPFADLPRKLPNAGHHFLTWIDSRRFLDASGPGGLWERDAETGASGVHHGQAHGNQSHLMFVSPAPANAPAPFIASVKRDGRSSISFVRRDFGLGRRVWSEPQGASGSAVLANIHPRVDPVGQYVAWTRTRAGGNGPEAPRAIALKHVGDAPDAPPTMLGMQYRNAYFCDWTEQGTLLVNVSENNQRWSLAVLDRDGRLLRTLGTAIPPAKGVIASWRKYGHR